MKSHHMRHHEMPGNMVVFWLALIMVLMVTLFLFFNIDGETIQSSKYILFPHPENAS